MRPHSQTIVMDLGKFPSGTYLLKAKCGSIECGAKVVLQR